MVSESNSTACVDISNPASQKGRKPSRAAKRGCKGYFVEPTVLVDTPHTKVLREEIFGPVVAAIPFNELDDLATKPMTPSTAWQPASGPGYQQGPFTGSRS